MIYLKAFVVGGLICTCLLYTSQSYKSVEKNLGMGTEEIVSLWERLLCLRQIRN